MDMHTDIYKAIGIGRLFPCTVIMVVMISHRFQVAGGLVFLPQTIIHPDHEGRQTKLLRHFQKLQEHRLLA